MTPTSLPKLCGYTTLHDGNAGGYLAANAICQAQVDPSAHVCTVEDVFEIINSGLAPGGGYGWTAAGPPGSTVPSGYAADCLGFTTNSNIQYGNVWIWGTQGGQGVGTPCNSQTPFLCCCFE